MKLQLVLVLVACLTFAGTPLPTHSEANPKASGSLQVSVKLDKDAKNSLKSLETKNPSLLNQKAGDGKVAVNDKKQEKDGGISDSGAIALGILLGGVGIAVLYAVAISGKGGC